MLAPSDTPPRIRTDESNAFAQHTMRVRVPAILETTTAYNPDYPAIVREGLAALAEALRTNGAVPELQAETPHAEAWLAALAARAGARWLSVDWFFAENYVYRSVADLTGFWRSGRDPFAPIKLEEYAGTAHREALLAAAEIAAATPLDFAKLLEASVFGNRIDLSFKASLDRGTRSDSEDLLLDDRGVAVRALESGDGPVHMIIDNAGSELSVDLVLASALLEDLNAPVTLHFKVHPAFVSDAIIPDLDWFLGNGAAAETAWRGAGSAALNVRERLRRARVDGRLRALAHPFWNGPQSLWEMPDDLARTLDGARLVILKGDAHYRRAVGDALWPPETPFRHVTSYFEWPLLALRTLKSDPIVGLAPGQALALDQADPSWRINGRRGVASIGGNLGPYADRIAPSMP